MLRDPAFKTKDFSLNAQLPSLLPLSGRNQPVPRLTQMALMDAVMMRKAFTTVQ